MRRLTTDKKGNIKIDGNCTGWSISKNKNGWFTTNFDEEKSQEFKTKKQALGASGLDW